MGKDTFSEVAGTLLLLGAAGYALRYWRDGRNRSPLWVLIALGMLMLSFDEALSLHERLGRWSDAQAWRWGPVNHNDDVFMLAYVFGAVALVVVYGHELWNQPRAVLLPLLVGVAASAGSIVVDAFAAVAGVAPVAEETLELLGAGLILVALRARYRAPAPAPDLGAAPEHAHGDAASATAAAELDA
ncbi:MAG: hypothetical protein FJ035_03005 [Chloroflexi bacterium]|nr:hypothetical protein [Chloroflexota bacterium]